MSGWASLLVVLLLGPAAWPRAAAPPEDLPPQGGAPRMEVVVHQGRLSVDLWEADLGEVLAQIQQQAEIPSIVRPRAGPRISAQFTGVALEAGLRRLLQLAAQSYAMVYAPGSAGGVVIQEVRVFERAPAEGRPTSVAARATEDPGAEETGRRFVDALRQHQAAAPAVANEDASEVARHFRDTLERRRELTPGATDASASDTARRFRDTLERSLGAPPR